MPRGHTLLELVISSATATLLLGGMASTIFVASRALDLNTGTAAERSKDDRAISHMLRNVRHALRFSELTATAMTFTVPDRDGDGNRETIRYAWGGSVGDPLTYSYNSATPVMLIDDVQSLSFTPATRLMSAANAAAGVSQTVLFVSGQPSDGDGGLGAPTSNEQILISLIESWGYTVELINQQASSSDFNDELGVVDVVYVSGQVSTGTLGSKLNSTSLGIITESFGHAQQLGFYGGMSPQYLNKTDISFTNTVHYITSGFSTGVTTIASAAVPLKWTSTAASSGSNQLADVDEALNYPTLLVLDEGSDLADGNDAPGRRVQLPWGDSGTDSSRLSTNALTIMQRSLEWAAGSGDNLSNVVFEGFDEAKLTSNGTQLDVPYPAGTAAGDLLILCAAIDGIPGSPTAAGWTQIDESDQDGRVTLAVWWKLATSPVPSSQQVTWDNPEKAYGWMMRFTGHDPSIAIGSTATDGGGSSTPTAKEVSTSYDNCLILRIGAFNNHAITADDAGMTDHTTITMDESHDGDGAASGGAAYTYQASLGNTGTADFTLTDTDKFRTMTIAIVPDQNE